MDKRDFTKQVGKGALKELLVEDKPAAVPQYTSLWQGLKNIWQKFISQRNRRKHNE